MSEPLGVKEEIIDSLGQRFINEGHSFVLCFKKIDSKDEMSGSPQNVNIG